MLSTNLKKKVAVLLTGAMVFGMTVTAAAADPVTVNGSGANEGHVNKKVVSVTLPTADANAKTFDYIADPEGLVAATTHARYPDATFPGSGDTNVYFKTGDKTYANQSKALTVSNNSSVSINVTVKVELTPGSDDMDLVSKNAIAAAKNPSLYLGLTVGNKPTEAVTSEGATVSISMNKAEGYSVSWNSTESKYEYVREKTAPAAPHIDFSVEGATKVVDSAKGKTAPALKVTWSYVPSETEDEEESTDPGTDPVVEDKAPSMAKTSYTKEELSGDSGVAKFDVDFGSGSLAGTEITKVWFSADGTTYKEFSATNTPIIDNEGHSFSINKTYFRGMSAKRWIRAYFDGSDDKYVEITVTP